MSGDSAFRTAAVIQAVEEGVTYDDIVAAQVGTSVLAALTHYDRRTAIVELLNNRRHTRLQASRRRKLRRTNGYTVSKQGPHPF